MIVVMQQEHGRREPPSLARPFAFTSHSLLFSRNNALDVFSHVASVMLPLHIPGVSVVCRLPSLLLSATSGRRTDREMWALQAWGELALGLAAPRAVHHSAGNDYGNQTLAWDVVSGRDLARSNVDASEGFAYDIDGSSTTACLLFWCIIV